MLEAVLGTGYPVARIPRRIVAHMMLMAILGNPSKAFIQVIIQNFTWRLWGVQLQQFHVIDSLRYPSVSVRGTITGANRDAHVCVLGAGNYNDDAVSSAYSLC